MSSLTFYYEGTGFFRFFGEAFFVRVLVVAVPLVCVLAFRAERRFFTGLT